MNEQILVLWKNHSSIILGISYKIILTCITLAIGRVLIKIVHRSMIRPSKKFELLDESLISILRKITTLAIYLLALIIILDIFGINTTSIVTLLGAAGLAIGLALKDTLGNVAAGIVLLLLRPFKVGHYIEFGATAGEVIEIGLLVTILKTPDGLFISAPNSSLWIVPIKNYSRNGLRRLDLIVGIAYTDSIDAGFVVFNDIIHHEKRFLKSPAPQMMVQSMGDSAVNLQLRAWLKVEDYWDVYWELNKSIKEKIEAAGLSFPFPQADVHLFQK